MIMKHIYHAFCIILVGLKADDDSEVQFSQSSTSCCAVENLEQEGVQDHISSTKLTTPGPQSVQDTCQGTTEPIDGIQTDQSVVQAEDRPIAAPMLGDIKMKIKIP